MRDVSWQTYAVTLATTGTHFKTVHILRAMHFEWGTTKAASNVRKHGVRFSEAAVALQDDSAVTIDDPDSKGEERFASIRVDDRGRVLVTIFTYREEEIRIVSSRPASKKERQIYE